MARKVSLACVCLLAAVAGFSVRGNAAGLDGTFGTIVGVVSSSSGVAQMGATVFLYNRSERLVRKTITNGQGAFGFDSLPPDNYSLRVTLASFMPAVRQNVLVQPGMRSFLSINMASVLSSIELVYNASGQGAIMSDDWKWVLRGSMATRPVLRALPELGIEERRAGELFSNTRGLFRVSAGDGYSSSADGDQQDLGTAFALATMLGGSHQLQFSGNLGMGQTGGMPSAGFRTRLSRVSGDAFGLGFSNSPEVNLTMRQVFLPLRGRQSGAPAIRTMSATFADRAQLTEDLQLLYGAGLESITFLDRLNYLSPFAKLSYRTGTDSAIELGYSSGLPPVELYQNAFGPDSDLQQDLAALSLFPRLSLRNGSTFIQRQQNFEAGYRASFGSTTFSVSAFHQQTTNTASSVSGDTSLLGYGNALPDLFTRTSVFNLGGFGGFGGVASVSQNIGELLGISVSYGNTSVLKASGPELVFSSADDLRSLVRAGRQQWGAARVSLTAPWTGTKFVTGYQLTGSRVLNPSHRFLTQRYSPETGLNVLIRQPIPSLGMWSGRLEATAEMRNMLAQGYVPLTTSDGRRLFLIQTPKAVRGGLSFIF